MYTNSDNLGVLECWVIQQGSKYSCNVLGTGILMNWKDNAQVDISPGYAVFLLQSGHLKSFSGK